MPFLSPAAGQIPFFGPAAVEAVNSVKVDQMVNSCERWKAQLHDFRHEFRDPVTGITLSTRVGRLSETHSDIVFQLHSVPTLGRKVRERMSPQKTVLLNNVGICTRKRSDTERRLQSGAK